MNAAVKAAGSDYEKAGASAKSGGAGFTEAGGAAKGAGSAAAGASKQIAGAGESTGIAGKAMGYLKDVAHEAAGSFVGFVGAQGVMNLTGRAVSFAKDTILGFNDAMTQSTAIMGNLSAAQKEALGNTARETAKKYGEDVSAVANGFYFLASAGYDAATSQKAIGQVTAFAKAGMFDLEKATELAADAQNAMGLKSDNASENLTQLTRITDVLTQANIMANGSVEQFGDALTNKAAASARLANISLEDTVGVLEAFAAQGLKGLKAGEAFSIVLRELQTQSAKNGDAFKAMGVEVYDSQGAFNGFPAIIGQLENALKGQSVEMVNAKLATLGFTAEGAAYIKTLLGMSSEIQRYSDKNREASGATQELAGKQMTSLINRLGQLRANAQDLALSGFGLLVQSLGWLQEKFGPALAGGAEALAGMARVVAPVAQGMAMLAGAAVIGGLTALAATLGAVTGFLKDHEAILELVASVGMALVIAKALAMGGAFLSLAADFGALQLFALAGQLDSVVASMSAVTAQSGFMGGALVGINAVVGSTAFGIGALALVILGLVQVYNESNEQAKQWADGLTKTMDPSDIDSMSAAVRTLTVEQDKLTVKMREMTDSPLDRAGTFLSSVADAVIPFHDVKDSMIDMEAEAAEAGRRLGDLSNPLSQATRNVGDLAAGFSKSGADIGRSTGEIETQLKALAKEHKIDVSTAEGKAALEKLYATTVQGGPVLSALAGSFGTMGDSAASAKEKVDAFKDALDKILGVNISVNEAQNKVATGFRDVAKAAIESKEAGISGAQAFDLNSEAAKRNLDAVVNNRESINSQVGAIRDMAEAYRNQGKSAGEAAADMMAQRDQLVKTAEGFGLTKAQAEAYLATLGLTPENIRTIAHAETDDATAKMSALDTLFDQAVVPRTAVVAMDGTQASTAADVVGKLLDDTSRNRTAVIDGNAAPATQVGQFLDGYLNTVTGAERVALLQADARAAAGTGSELDNFLSTVMRQRVASLLGNGDQARAEASRTGVNLDVAMSNRQATLTANGQQAIDEANRVWQAMARATAQSAQLGIGDTRFEALHRADGGITLHQYARGGMLAAEAYANGESHVAQIAPAGAWRVWAEPETGGESYIPLAGEKRPQSTKILEKTADLFGYQLVPKGTIPYASGGLGRTVRTPRANWGGPGSSSTVGPINVSVSVNADSRVSHSEVLAAVNAGMGEFSRNLRTEIRGRRV